MHSAIPQLRKQLACILLLVASGLAQAGGVEVGKELPAVQARLMDGSSTVHLPDKGKVTILHFWATWCPQCKVEMPDLQTYYLRHRDQGLQVLAINMDEPGKLAAAMQVAKDTTFPMAWQGQASFERLGRIWRLPATYVIDLNGVVRRDGSSGKAEIDLATLERTVTPLLTAH